MTDIFTNELNGMNVEALKALELQIKELKASKKDTEKSESVKAKAEKVEAMKASLKDGQTVKFLYGRENELCEGTVVRVSEKTVTVKSDIFAENGKKGSNYVRFDRIVEIVAVETEAPAVDAE